MESWRFKINLNVRRNFLEHFLFLALCLAKFVQDTTFLHKKIMEDYVPGLFQSVYTSERESMKSLPSVYFFWNRHWSNRRDQLMAYCILRKTMWGKQICPVFEVLPMGFRPKIFRLSTKQFHSLLLFLGSPTIVFKPTCDL